MALPLGFLPSAWRVAAAVARAGVERLDKPFAPPDGWRRELRTVAALCALPRLHRVLPVRSVQVAVDASPMGWAALVLCDGWVGLSCARWSERAPSMPIAETVAGANVSLILAAVVST